MDAVTKDGIWASVDMMLALQGEQFDGPAARAACHRLLDTEEFSEVPVKKGEQIGFLDRLAVAVLTEVGKAPPEQQTRDTAPVSEGFADSDDGSITIIRTPIGG